MAEVVQAPGPLSIQGVQGNPFGLVLNVTVKDSGGTPIPWTDVTSWTAFIIGMADYSVQPVPLPVLVPTITSPSTGVLNVDWSTDTTQKFDAYKSVKWTLAATIQGQGPWAIVAGDLTMEPPTTPGVGTGDTANVTVTVGAAPVDLVVTV